MELYSEKSFKNYQCPSPTSRSYDGINLGCSQIKPQDFFNSPRNFNVQPLLSSLHDAALLFARLILTESLCLWYEFVASFSFDRRENWESRESELARFCLHGAQICLFITPSLSSILFLRCYLLSCLLFYRTALQTFESKYSTST